MYRYFLVIFTAITQVVLAQDAAWNKIGLGNSGLPNETIKCIEFDKDGAMWVGTYMGGLAVLKDDKWTVYNTTNSELPHNYINAIAIDRNNVKWIGTDGGGLTQFDGQTWKTFKTSNSSLPSNVVMSVFADDNGIIWVGTYFGGLARFDGTNWQIYKDDNSPLLSNKVVVIKKDTKNLLWIGTQGGGVASFDGQNWNIYTERNSKLASDYIYSIAIDKQNNKWFGTGGGGLAVFNGENWLSFTSKNSKITDDNVRPIYIGEQGYKWIGTYIGGLNLFDGEKWKVYDYQNSSVPDDEITCISHDQYRLLIGTERSGIITFQDTIKQSYTTLSDELALQEITPVLFEKEPEPVPIKKEESKPEKKAESKPEKKAEPKPEKKTLPKSEKKAEPKPDPEKLIVADAKTEKKAKPEPKPEKKAEPKIKDTVPEVQSIVTPQQKHKIVVMFDAADLNRDKTRMNMYMRSFKILLRHRERINKWYDVTLMIYSSNSNINPKKIIISKSKLNSLRVANVVYLDGETNYTEAIKKAFGTITKDFSKQGNNHVISATYKFIREDEKAKVIIKENVQQNNIVFSLLAFETRGWKMEYKMRDLVPKGRSHYYSINRASIKDNWSVTAQFGISIFKGDMDVSQVISFPGVVGFAVNKQVLSTGIINGGIKAQFNFGSLNGSKNSYSFENKYKEGCLNFQVILNNLMSRNFRFETIRPYAFAGLGFINYRVLLRDGSGNVVNGYGYKVNEGDIEGNGTDPEKTSAATDMIFPVGAGVNYKLNPKLNLELEASSRFMNSDKLDGKCRFENDKYWFVSIGVTYLFSNKEFLADILNR
jgi:thymidylate synthase